MRASFLRKSFGLRPSRVADVLTVVISDSKSVVLMVCSVPPRRLRNAQELFRNACLKCLLLDHWANHSATATAACASPNSPYNSDGDIWRIGGHCSKPSVLNWVELLTHRHLRFLLCDWLADLISSSQPLATGNSVSAEVISIFTKERATNIEINAHYKSLRGQWKYLGDSRKPRHI